VRGLARAARSVLDGINAVASSNICSAGKQKQETFRSRVRTAIRSCSVRYSRGATKFLGFSGAADVEEGYGVYAVEDASGGTSKAAHDAGFAALQAGADRLRFAGVARIPTRLVAQGALRRSDGSREGTLWGVRPGHRNAATMVQKSAASGTDKPQILKHMNTKIAPTDLTQRPPRSFHVRLGGFVILLACLTGSGDPREENGEYNYILRLTSTLSSSRFDPEALLKELAAGKATGRSWDGSSPIQIQRAPWEIEAWSAYMEKRGPDSDGETLTGFAEYVGQHSKTRETLDMVRRH